MRTCLGILVLLPIVFAGNAFEYNGNYKLFGGNVSEIKVIENGTIYFEGSLVTQASTYNVTTTLQLPNDHQLPYQRSTLESVSATNEDVLSIVEHFGFESLDSIQRLELIWGQVSLPTPSVSSGIESGEDDSLAEEDAPDSIHVKIDMITAPGQISLMILHLADYSDTWAIIGSDEPKVKLTRQLLGQNVSFELGEEFYNKSNVSPAFPGVWILKTDSAYGHGSTISSSVVCSNAALPNTALETYNMTHASYQCTQGYASLKKINTVCNAGSWKIEQPSKITYPANWMTCYKLECDEIRLDSKSFVILTSSPFEDARPIGAAEGKVKFACHKNYIPDFGKGTCLSNGSWNWDTAPNGPRCNIDTSILCPTPPQIPDTYIASSGPYPLLSTVYYYCNLGFYPNTTNLTATCNDRQVWTIPKFNCGPFEEKQICADSGLFQEQYELPIVVALGVVTALSWIVAVACCRTQSKKKKRVITPTRMLKISENRRPVRENMPSFNINIRGLSPDIRSSDHVRFSINRSDEYDEF